MSAVKVSIIITIYNQIKYLKDSIESALAQTLDDKEIIIIDDCSNDGSFSEILNITASQKICPIKIIRNDKNKGVIYSRNKGINLATGEYILPLDGDDIILPKYTQIASNYLDNHEDCGIVYCQVEQFGERSGLFCPPEFDPSKIWILNQIISCALFRKTDWIKVNGYDPLFTNGHEDWDLWISILSLGRKAHKIDKVLFKYRILKTSRTTRAILFLKEAKLDILRKHINWILSMPQAAEYLLQQANSNLELERITNENTYIKNKLDELNRNLSYLNNEIGVYKRKYRKYRLGFIILLSLLSYSALYNAYFL